jgi:hypothetical protein
MRNIADVIGGKSIALCSFFNRYNYYFILGKIPKIHTYIHTYYSRFILEGVPDASQILKPNQITYYSLLQFYQNYLPMRNTVDVKGGKSIAV